MSPAHPVAEIWQQVTTVAPAPPSGLLLGTAAVALALVMVPEAWRRTRHLVTIAHEGAHGLAAALSGRRLAGIRLHSDTSGLTVSKGRSSGPGMVATAAAGYVGPGLVGLGAAGLLARGYAVGVLWALLVLLALLLLQIRNFFGLWAAPRPVVELQEQRRHGHGRSSDADVLARLTRVPGLLWVGLFLVVTVGCLVLGGSMLLGRTA